MITDAQQRLFAHIAIKHGLYRPKPKEKEKTMPFSNPDNSIPEQALSPPEDPVLEDHFQYLLSQVSIESERYYTPILELIDEAISDLESIVSGDDFDMELFLEINALKNCKEELEGI